MALQIEHRPYLVQEELLTLARNEDIAVVGYSSFGPLSFRELEWKKALDAPLLFEHDVIKSVAGKHGKTEAQVLLRWATQRGVAVIPKSIQQTRLRENLDVMGFELEEGELRAINGLDRGLRFNNPSDVSFVGVGCWWEMLTCGVDSGEWELSYLCVIWGLGMEELQHQEVLGLIAGRRKIQDSLLY